jgi:hypothetical protein
MERVWMRRAGRAAVGLLMVLLGIPPTTISSSAASTPRSPVWRISGRAQVIGPGVTYATSKVSVLGGLGWLPELVDPAVAVSRGGSAVVAWPGPSGVLAALGYVRAGFSHPPSKPATSLPAQATIAGVRAAISARGGAVVSWRVREGVVLNGGPVSGAASLVPPAAAWRALPVAGASWERCDEFARAAPSVAFDDQGDGFAVWVAPAVRTASRAQPQEQVEASFMPAGTKAWQRPVAISPVRPVISDPQVAVDAGGGAVAVWSAARTIPNFLVGCSSLSVEASLHPSGAHWSRPARLGEGMEPFADSYEPMIVIRPRGEALVVWRESGEGLPLLWRKASLAHVRWGASGSILGTEGTDADTVQVGIASGRHGATAVWWVTERGNRATLREVASAPRKGWSSPRTIARWRSAPEGLGLPTCRHGARPFIGFDHRENAIAVWQENCGATFTAMRRASSKVWSGARRLVGVPNGASSTFALGSSAELLAASLTPASVSPTPLCCGQVITTTVHSAVFRRVASGGAR